MKELFDKVPLTDHKNDSLFKVALRKLWVFLITLYVLCTISFFSRDKKLARVFYAGGRPGNLGGPLVKIKRLNDNFPQELSHFNIVYVLSNANYLSKFLIDFFKKKKIPIILNQNGIFYPGWYGAGWEKKNNEMSYVYHNADYVLWQSKFCKDAADKFLGKREGGGEILYNAINTSIFKPKKNLETQPFTFLITGKIDNHLFYRLDTSIKALRKVIDMGFDVQIKIAGYLSNSIILKLYSLIEDLNLGSHVIVSGEYSQANAANVYQSSDAYIMMKYLDSCPNVVLEAMSCGLPILYSASGGVPELVGSEAGVGLYVPENWGKSIYVPALDEIATGMIKIMQNRLVMSTAARIRAIEFFDTSNWINRHKKVFKKFLELSK
jgi:glycosyltransferase involved in cell wall biosynthesis